ncbi:restriction endonuclease subunit S [Desulfobotulus mexicanus]|uniref:Restriction endonuclease subunit S n=1 Tax=Desulfobotulus mexicanus TaxID=2586642 RepID=A0A5S5MEH8_9BACT|nr:restriction endonuclease subunit S [Desulfobotulus mexicanus]TYT74133.1 restriction endonuclease subunit S [Desulfobotulus mexicanus]
MKYGLSEKQLEEIIDFIAGYPEVETALLFGSRALGTFREASDVDIALQGEGVTFALAAKMKFNIEEDSYLPFIFDFIAYPTITNEALRKHIDTKGVVIFRRGESDWKEMELGDVCTLLDCLHKTPKYSGSGYPMVRVTDVKNGFLDTSECLLVDEEVFKAFSKDYKPKIGDIIFTRVGSFGLSAIVKKEERFCIGQNTTLLLPNKIDPFFIFYFLIGTDARNQIEGLVGGSTQPTISMANIRKIIIPYPSIDEQKAIASVLTCLDDKIDLLHRQNKTLEAMAETLFRQWFVEEAQEDWEEGKMGDIVTVVSGTTPKTSKPEYWNGEYHWTSPRDITTLKGLFLFDTERKITKEGLEQIGSGLLPSGSLLMSSRAPVGALAFAEIPVAINQGYAGIICDKGFSREYVYLWLKTNMDFVKSHANGSTFQEISKSAFRELAVNIPDNKSNFEFNKLISPSFTKIKTNCVQIQTLEKLRDTLLPKLMSGEVRVEI